MNRCWCVDPLGLDAAGPVDGLQFESESAIRCEEEVPRRRGGKPRCRTATIPRSTIC
jgi:hypothetical protein